MDETTRLQKMFQLVERMAAMTKDGECLVHGGGYCEVETDECELFDLTNDDAVDTLHTLIDAARELDVPGEEEA